MAKGKNKHQSFPLPIRIALLFSVAVFCLPMPLIALAQTTQSQSPQEAGPVNGWQWKEINSYHCSLIEKRYIKVMLLMLVYETNLFQGTPLFPFEAGREKSISTYGNNFYAYSKIIDKFYADPGNLNFPLRFALIKAHTTRSSRDSSKK